MKECQNILLYVSGELPTQQQTAFAAHLAACKTCQQQVAFLQKTQEALEAPSAPAQVVEHLFAKTSRRRSAWSHWKEIVATSVLAGVCMWGFIVGLPFEKTAFDRTEVIAYMTENMDEDYLSFASDLDLMEEDF